MKVVAVILCVLLWTADGYAQSRADKLFERGDYLNALSLYQKEMNALSDEDDSEQANVLRMRVANCFFHLNDMVRAGQIYKKVNPDLMGAEDLVFYAVTLQRAGDYEEALEQIDIAEALGAAEEVVAQVRKSCEFARQVAQEKPRYSANKTKVDFAGFSSGVTYYKGRNVILAAPGYEEGAQTDSRGYKLTRLYNAVFTGDGTSGRMVPFAKELAGKYHIGAVTFTSDFRRIYYTETILKPDGTSILKLMTAEEEGGKWGTVEALDINSDDYSCAHPCLFRDSLLFFVSDMPGGLGGKDIYVTEVNGAQCGEIRNLGAPINTELDESFPFVSKDGKLYFASNGHVGLGGLDVFVSKMLPTGGWSEPENMGRPINSSMDDFALVFRTPDCTEGYVSSNRGGTGYNDYLFALKKLSVPRETKRSLVRVETSAQVEEQAEVPKEELFAVDYRYAIQIGAFRNPVPRAFFEHFTNVKVYLGYDNVYRYTIGEYPEDGLAKRDLPYVRREVHDAFVMNVDKYVKEKKIQGDIRGDKISDDELLLRRLKNFEKANRAARMKKQEQSLPAVRTLDKPRENEVGFSDKGYTVVLMSADRVYDPSSFREIQDVDVFLVDRNRYMYCSGMFATVKEANVALNRARNCGFKDAYILRRKDGEFYAGPAMNESSRQTTQRSVVRRNNSDLKNILNL